VVNEEEGDLGRALDCARRAAAGWKDYLVKWPDDPFGRGRETYAYVLDRIKYLEGKIREQEGRK
jgi:hypothetical protein